MNTVYIIQRTRKRLFRKQEIEIYAVAFTEELAQSIVRIELDFFKDNWNYWYKEHTVLMPLTDNPFEDNPEWEKLGKAKRKQTEPDPLMNFVLGGFGFSGCDCGGEETRTLCIGDESITVCKDCGRQLV